MSQATMSPFDGTQRPDDNGEAVRRTSKSHEAAHTVLFSVPQSRRWSAPWKSSWEEQSDGGMPELYELRLLIAPSLWE